MSAPIITLPAARLQADGLVQRDEAAPGARLRLTRRGRIVLGVLALLVLGALLSIAVMFASTAATAADETAGDAQFGYVIVQPGESLWGVATALDPSSDPRDLIAEIVRLNQLGGSDIQAGQPIAVPMRYADAPGVIPADELGL